MMQVSIKNVEKEVFRDFKMASVSRGLPMGRSLTLAMKLWNEKVQKKTKMSILNIKQKSWGKGTEKTSEEIDNILY